MKPKAKLIGNLMLKWWPYADRPEMDPVWFARYSVSGEVGPFKTEGEAKNAAYRKAVDELNKATEAVATTRKAA